MKQHSGTGPRTARAALAPALALALALAGGLMMPASGSARAQPSTAGGPIEISGQPDGSAASVTLITGDIVHWTQHEDGTGSAVIEDKGPRSTFQTIEDSEDYYVIPSDVSVLVGGYLDRELFNVAGLVEQGYTDELLDATPVILTGDPDAREAMNRRAAADAPGLSVDRALPSINGKAGTFERSEASAFGQLLAQTARKHQGSKGAAQSVTPPISTDRVESSDTSDVTVASLPGVEKIWLDRKVEAQLDTSVPQTGAAVAWDAGYDGTGMTIAVLDTGIDATHPDVADNIVAAEDFTGSGSTVDRHSHGTHVASIAAGSGAASGGTLKGVAPGADLVIGKVMNDEGAGMTSQILAGMEWAAAYDGVDVINMSLGGAMTDGSDPMSQAVNRLTEEHGVLFVASAGNDGPGRRTVSYPATADAALAVGAVDDNGKLAGFSSRGPRAGDWAITPQITAPGVKINAARAAGTGSGSDLMYHAKSGTSMAAPHVAGAAAIVRQQHPDWDPATVKAALINSADPNPTNSVYEQGGGELDIAAAINNTIVSSPSVMDLGVFEFPHVGADPVTQTLSYINHGDASQTIDLSVQDLKDDLGAAADPGMITLQPTTLTLEPGASGEVQVTLDRSLGAEALFGGTIVASDAGGERLAGTPIGFYKEPELYDVTVTAVQHNGEHAQWGSSVDLLNVDDRSRFQRTSVDFVDGQVTMRVPPGNYSLMTGIMDLDGADATGFSLMGYPQLSVTKDIQIDFDADDATEIAIDTPYEQVDIAINQIQYRRLDGTGKGYAHSWAGGDVPLYALPTDPVGIGTFEFGTKWVLSAPDVLMDLAYPAKRGSIPTDLAYDVRPDNVATAETTFHADVPQDMQRVNTSRFPWEANGLAVYLPVDHQSQRTELYSATDVTWRQNVWTSPAKTFSILGEPETRYTGGEHFTQSWFKGPRTPGLDEGNEVTPSDLPWREADSMRLRIFEWSDANTGEPNGNGQQHWAPRDSFVDTSAFRMFVDGELYATGQRGFGTVPVPAQDSRYRFELDVDRDADWWTTSTRTRTAWEFDSSTTATKEALPLLMVDYDINLDPANTAVHPRKTKAPFTIGLDVHQPFGGAPDSEVASIRAWVSYDDGETWKERRVTAGKDGRFTFATDNRAGGGAVSLKIEAHDAAGNSIEQEVIRAYNLRP